MYGAIIGDVAGSIYEVLEIKAVKNKSKRTKEEREKIMDLNVPLFTNMSSMTDDSVLTCAIADAIIDECSYEEKLREYGLKEISLGDDLYGRSRFGSGFVKWLYGLSDGKSYGNGCAMRISPIGYLYNDINEIKKQSKLATVPSHNHSESILCSEAVAVSIYLLRNGTTKEELKKYIEDNYFKLHYDFNELRENYKFTSRAINSVPEAIYAFLESDSFLDAIRKAISIGGDADTIACITGAIAESYYDVPQYLIDEVNHFIPDNYKKIVNEFYLKYKCNNKNNVVKKRILKREI